MCMFVHDGLLEVVGMMRRDREINRREGGEIVPGRLYSRQDINHNMNCPCRKSGLAIEAV